MKKKAFMVMALLLLACLLLSACGSSGSSYSYSNSSGSNNSFGYGDPKPGESLSDYIQREDPDLWKSMEDRYYNLQP